MFAVCIFCGGAIGFLFDLFRITRRLFRTSNIVATTEDIVFWIVASAVFFAVVLKISSGEIRFFQLVALFIGTVLYFLTISPLIIKVSVLVLRFVARVLIFIVKIVMAPALLVCRIVKKPLLLVLRLGRKSGRHLKNKISIGISNFNKFHKRI